VACRMGWWNRLVSCSCDVIQLPAFRTVKALVDIERERKSKPQAWCFIVYQWFSVVPPYYLGGWCGSMAIRGNFIRL